MIDNRMKNTVRNSTCGLVNKLCIMIFPFIIRTLMIKFMGADYLGLNSLFTSVLQVLSLAELGMSSAIIFSMYKPIAEEDTETICALYNLFKKIYRIIGIIILIMGIIIMPLLPYCISGHVPDDINIYILYIIYLFNTVISYFLFAYKECLLTAHQRSYISSNISTVANILMYIIQCVVIITVKNYYVYIIFLPACTIMVNLFRSYKVNKMFPQYSCKGNISDESKKELIKKVGGLMLYKISGVCRNSFDSIILSSFLGLFILTKYQNYYYIMNSIGGILAIITTSATASIGNSIAVESVKKNKENFNKFSLLYNWISGWCTVCLLCLYQPFIKIWLGEEYLFKFDIVILLCIYFYVCKVADILYMYRQAAGLWWEDKYRSIVESVVNLVLNIILVRHFGVCGVIISTIISIIFINIPWGAFVLYKYYFRLSMVDYLKQISWNAFVVLIACVTTLFLCDFIKLEGVVCIVIRLGICVIVPNMIFFGMYRKSKELSNVSYTVKRILQMKLL